MTRARGFLPASLLPASLLILLLLASGAQARERRHAAPVGEAGQFDYYMLSLSWSPSYCATRSNPDADPGQCGNGRRLGFVLHGLWPQYDKGYPQSCSTAQLPDNVRAKYAGLYPSPSLIDHEWPKHGTCSGLAPAAYFDLSAKLKNSLQIPSAYRQPAAPVRVTYSDFTRAFQSANPALASNAVLPFCTRGGEFLQEIRVCYDKNGASQSCAPQELKRSHSSCGQPSFLLRSVR
ncbi:ribonuclease T2 family protein [Janthinobacterium agaricidamnosum]|uniref:Ribonuclease T2 family protein n=1 Tax=Janthinobacterium agaricidamnosum NBRC 102515 = DSM 9628 TaxID=1349767 RepID=W0V7L5_9BURK|nr:ribonuclease T2 [Janthinobacterium agaricidamnosum]CDG83338.1 ribonuclease T2 family protein [Janthinobacterium agaricidamnosum NBRC 102515 = DSM 9628]